MDCDVQGRTCSRFVSSILQGECTLFLSTVHGVGSLDVSTFLAYYLTCFHILNNVMSVTVWTLLKKLDYF